MVNPRSTIILKSFTVSKMKLVCYRPIRREGMLEGEKIGGVSSEEWPGQTLPPFVGIELIDLLRIPASLKCMLFKETQPFLQVDEVRRMIGSIL